MDDVPLQLGFSGEPAGRYADEWTVAVIDVIPLAREIHGLVSRGELDDAARLLPRERPYPAGDELPPGKHSKLRSVIAEANCPLTASTCLRVDC
ncbi:DUF4291 family protein [Streptomyces sp. NPDC005122]